MVVAANTFPLLLIANCGLLMRFSRYCYWSVATAAYAERMQACVDSARACGVFKDFHVLTSQPLRGCECYDLMEFQPQGGLFPVFYLELAMRKLNYDYFVWVDADTRFDHAPLGLLETVRYSPIHAPLLRRLSEEKEADRCRWLREGGVLGSLYECGTAFWIAHREAIESVYTEVRGYWQRARWSGVEVGFGEALGYVVQMFCGDVERHVIGAWPGLWGEIRGLGAERSSMVHLGAG